LLLISPFGLPAKRAICSDNVLQQHRNLKKTIMKKKKNKLRLDVSMEPPSPRDADKTA